MSDHFTTLQSKGLRKVNFNFPMSIENNLLREEHAQVLKRMTKICMSAHGF